MRGDSKTAQRADTQESAVDDSSSTCPSLHAAPVAADALGIPPCANDILEVGVIYSGNFRRV